MFEHLIGNDAAKRNLQRLVENGRVPNSLLFAGPDGVGKKLFALELARLLVISKSEGVSARDPEGERVSRYAIPESSDKNKDDFKSVFFTQHPDVGIITAYKRNILVEAIRDLEREAFFRPYEAAVRVFIIDDADKMNAAASNALLKTLEEPASTSFLILVTSRPDSLLQTIRSRCQTIRFAPVEKEEIEKFLIDGKDFSPDDARLAASLANGSIAAAATIDVSDHRMRRKEMLAVLENAASGTGLAPLLRISEKMNDAKNKDLFEDNLAILESLVRDAWLLANGADENSIVNADIAAELRPLANAFSPTSLADRLNAIEELRQSFAVNINRKIATDALMVKFASA
ncbi:MAG: DNA polymerase III subunit delta' [Acidobacteria bacterium]|nr:DNA polymerase III subunit delta' [Acidobacteriota bacterium]